MTTTAPTTDSVESGIEFIPFILFGTDSPHPACLFGSVREKIEAGLAGQPWAVRRKLLWENAAALYRVDSPPTASP